ncbi:hypothetical protein LX87_02498 [Larkinella arboricola]|uniref:Uncharacterized protein n=1 Tax=Larkinella arboricola TaxID=643671 RepID=A0A327WYX2_LARAB|nr:hypothetical protein [Larkinella arboricola]RAJ97595.1 hypothetical protein LX87_02498 [Larkinella arboricola]
MQSHLTNALLKTILPLVCQTAASQQVILSNQVRLLSLLTSSDYDAIMQEQQQLIEKHGQNLMEMALREITKLTDEI